MRRLLAVAGSCLILSSLMLDGSILRPRSAAANECQRASLRGNLLSRGDKAKLSISGSSRKCRAPSSRSGRQISGPVYAYEVLCDGNSEQGPGTLCSVAPCLQANQSFALRSIRFPDGRMEPAGFRCINPAQTEADPGLTFAQIFSAIRAVELPGGRIRGAPATRGLANLRSFFWVEGVSQEPVEISIAGSVLYAEFRIVEYRWTFGSDRSLVTKGPGTPGLDSEVNVTFRRRGRYPVGVTVMWVAEAYLDGRRVGEVDELVSRAQTTYPVAELRTVLTG
jgi:hypothetical protein